LSKLVVQSDAYKQFVNSLRAKQTKITYTEWLNDFLKYLDEPDCDKLLEGEYSEIESDIVKKLFDDRIEFKLWAAQRHLDKLEKIENSYGGIMGKTGFTLRMN
jgi:hypothetical protein